MATEELSGLEDAAWRGFLLTHERLWRMRMSDLAERRLMSTGGFTASPIACNGGV